jgi:hypothetical protein
VTERDAWGEREPGRQYDTQDAAQGPAELGETAPPDLSAVQADDALLDALGGSDPKAADEFGDQELNELLLAWRRDIDSQPMPELVDLDTAVTTVQTAALAKRKGSVARRRRLLVPVAAAAAVLVIAFTGSGIAAREAEPGDALWGLSKVLYADHARSVEAAAAARLDLQDAQLALTQGRLDEARDALAQAEVALGQVSHEDNLDQLKAEHKALEQQLTPSQEKPAPPPVEKQPQPGTSATTTPPEPSKPSEPEPSSETPTPPTSSEITKPPTSSTSVSTPPPSSSTPEEGTDTDTTDRFDLPDAGTGAGAGPQSVPES